jgi:hypothetical protein
MSNAVEEASKVASSAIDALKSNPMCLALLILSLAFMSGTVFVAKGNRERQHEEMLSIYSRCFPLAGHEKL